MDFKNILISMSLLIMLTALFIMNKKRRKKRRTTVKVYHVKKVYEKILKLGIPLMARDGMLLGAVRHHGFIVFDYDPDVMITLNDFTKLMEADLSPYFVEFKSSYPRPLKYNSYPYTDGFWITCSGWRHKVLDGTVLFKDNEFSVKEGEDIYELGYELHGRNETELFYSAYGHKKTENLNL